MTPRIFDYAGWFAAGYYNLGTRTRPRFYRMFCRKNAVGMLDMNYGIVISAKANPRQVQDILARVRVADEASARSV